MLDTSATSTIAESLYQVSNLLAVLVQAEDGETPKPTGYNTRLTLELTKGIVGQALIDFEHLESAVHSKFRTSWSNRNADVSDAIERLQAARADELAALTEYNAATDEFGLDSDEQTTLDEQRVAPAQRIVFVCERMVANAEAHCAQDVLSLPVDVYSEVSCRSSYNRLGILVASGFQPGYRGCFSLEISNHSNIPVELTVGSRLVQAKFFKISENETYMRDGPRRKYLAIVRPVASRAHLDEDLVTLAKLRAANMGSGGN